jgi:hypothetical protein
MTGIPGKAIEDINLRDCSFSFVGGFDGDISNLQPPEGQAMYPGHFYFGVLPAACACLRLINLERKMESGRLAQDTGRMRFASPARSTNKGQLGILQTASTSVFYATLSLSIFLSKDKKSAI